MPNDLTDVAYAEAHKDYERRKSEIISKLNTLKTYLSEETISDTPIQWIDQVINFINEKEY